jgi:protein SCO1
MWPSAGSFVSILETTMIRKTRRAALVAALTGMVLSLALVRPAQAAADARPGRIVFPDVTLTTQDGDDVKFYDLIKGRIVAIDLIYTTCQYACPLESARLARMQQLLGDRMGKDIFFISISIDPEHDTPAALKAYGEKYNAGPGWIFLTGKQSDIDMLSKKLGLWTDPSLTQDGHTPMLLIGNEATGQWTQTSALDNPKYTAVMIEQWMGGYKNAVPTKTYADAKPIAKAANEGAYQFKSLCSNCHTIGGGDKIGPDLAVALDSRDREWLTEYSVQPDVVRGRNDPIAAMLADKYKHVRMPNLYLTVAEVKDILHYVELQKSHVTAAADAPATAPRPAATTGSSSAPSSSSPLVAPALAIQIALSRDTMVGVVADAKAIRDAAAALGAPGAAIAAAAGDLAAQTTIADARKAFGTMSEAIVASVNSGAIPLGDGVRVGYCPMVRKSWLQKDGPVANPYYGQKMLSCGELIK